MALIDVKDMPARRLFLGARGRVQQWLAGSHLHTQRMAGTAFTIRVISAGLMFVTQVLLARWMGDAEFGTYVYVWTWLLLIGEFAHFGVPLTAQRFVPEYHQAARFDLLRGYLSGGQWIVFGIATAFAVIGAILVRALETSLETNAILPFYFACAALPFYALSFMLDSQSLCYNWIRLALLPAYVARPIILITTLGMLYAGGIKIDAGTAMGVLAFAIWSTALLHLLQLKRGLKTVVEPGSKSYDCRRWLGTAMPIIVVWGMYTLLTSTDILVLKQFRPSEEVAHYYAAAKTLALVSIIHFAVAAAAGHRFTALHVGGDRQGLIDFAAGTVRWTFWPSLALTLLMLAAGPFVLRLFGPGFEAGYPVMAVLALGQLARAAIGPAERLLTVLGQQRICALAYTAAFTVNIVGCVLLAPVYGGIGAACATAGAFVVESMLLFLIARHRLGLHMFVRSPRSA
jgi:O-antigen/teichoic acid export membrane protein